MSVCKTTCTALLPLALFFIGKLSRIRHVHKACALRVLAHFYFFSFFYAQMLVKHLCVWSRISHRVYAGLQNYLHPLVLFFIGNSTACLVCTLYLSTIAENFKEVSLKKFRFSRLYCTSIDDTPNGQTTPAIRCEAMNCLEVSD